MSSLDFNITVALFAVGAGVMLASLVWMKVTSIIKKRSVDKIRREYESRLPISMEEVEAERELRQAKHIQDLRVMELRISELKVREAEAILKANNALSRVAYLNDRIERLRLELIVSRNKNKLEEDNIIEKSFDVELKVKDK
jgi:hypothetical protein